MQVQSVIHAQALLGEGALWNPEAQQLYWVDIEGRAFHIYDPATGQDVSFATPERVGTVVPVRSGDVLLALQNGIHRLDIATGQLRLLVNPIPNSSLRFNDGKCDPAGRFWVGTMSLEKTPRAATLYRFDPDGSIHSMLHGVTISNGIAWALDGKTMYYIDTPTLTVQAFDYDNATGTIANSRVVIRIPEGAGSPDGMTIDAEGGIL